MPLPLAARRSARQRPEREREAGLYPPLDEAALEAAHRGMAEPVRGGEGVEIIHVGRHDQKEDVAGAGNVEAELDVGAGDEDPPQRVLRLRGVTLELDVDHRRERVAGRRFREERDVCGDRAARAKPAYAAG